MADRNLVQELKRWATGEFSLPPDSLPNDSYFKTLCVGTGKSIWKYVIQHVFQQRNVRIMRGNLQWYPFTQLKQTEGQSEAAKQKELQRKIEQLRAEIKQSISRTWAQVEDSQHRELLLQAFKQNCILGSKIVTREQRTAMFQYWLSAVENLLGGYPPNHVLSALQYLASREQRELEDKLASLDVTQDVTALGFRYESNHLLDMSAEEDNELPPVRTLLQDAWEEVEQSLVELARTRSRVQQLKNQLQACKMEAQLEVSGIADELHNDTLAQSALELELQCVMQAAARDHIREQCIQLEQHARGRQEALRNLHSQWQSILDFRQLVVLRQEQIRGLIKGNSTAKTELIHLHRQSPTFSTMCQSLAFPLYKAPEELCFQARSQQLELRFLRQLLQLHSVTLQKIQKEAKMLHASDQKALLSRVVEEDQKLLKSLVPRVRSLTQHCAQGLSYADQVKTAISYCRDCPARQSRVARWQAGFPTERKPPVAGIMAKIQAHSTAKQINQIQDKPYVITQKQVQQQHFQKLKVEDALSYLDQVKIRFANDPGIYNKFLDIMKEFKSQSIDTPGVINRVSQLFHGHPDLVLGFNAFLPPGYRIEVPKNGMAFLQSPFSTQVSPGQQGKSLTTSAVPATSGSASAAHIEGGPAQTSEAKAASSESLPSSTSAGPPEPPSRLSLPLTSRESQNQATTSSVSPPASETSPVEFDSAISYVNKIKNRFLDHPEIYRAFLEILHTYQKEQLEVKESRGSRGSSGMTEDEVFSKVASLFKGQEDLLAEFGQFLPDAKRSLVIHRELADRGERAAEKARGRRHNNQTEQKEAQAHLTAAHVPLLKKKMKYSCTKDQSFASVGKHGVLREFSFFDKVRRLFKSQEVYENFLRCIALFNQEVVSGAELLQLVTPFLGKFPELYTQFKSFLGDKELSHAVSGLSDRYMEGGGGREVDYASCKRLGSSYRALPKTYQQPKCSGRTALCKEVLNDTWVSFPSWSEDSTFVSSKKTPYEEQLHRCEDERFELDVVLETNLATIRVLESVQKKLSRLSPEDQDRFRLDDCLGGTSEVIQRRAVYRIYGDKAPEIIEGLKRSPATAVPVVLKRLKAKEEEWREAQQGFNKIWREQYEKAYLKSLDHQGVNFKQNDMKALRSKSLLNEIESVYDERQEQSTEEGGVGQQGRNGSGSASSSEPHMVFTYEDKQILEDAASLIIYHVKRQPTIHKDDKDHIKRIIQHFVPDLFFSRRGELSDTEEWTDEEADPEEGGERGGGGGGAAAAGAGGGNGNSNNASGAAAATGSQSQPQPAQSQTQSQPQQQLNGESRRRRCSPTQPADTDASTTSSSTNQPAGTTTSTPGSTPMETGSGAAGEKVDLRDPEAEHQKELDGVYNLFFVNNNWYFFLRLHQTLCSRLLRVYRQAERQLLEHRAEQSRERLLMAEGRREKACDLAMELRLKQPSEVELEEYYPAFLDMVRSLLDGNLDSTQYEDTLREMFTIHAYIGFTIDKVIHNIIRQLQHLVSDEVCLQVVDLYLAERKRGAAGGNLSSQCVRAAWETSYQWKAERVMAEENCFKVMFIQNKGHVTMTIELLDTEEAQADDPLDVQCLSSYMEQFVGTESSLCSQAEGYFFKPVFLPRNLRRFRRWQVRQVEAMRCRREWHRQLGVENAGSLDCRFKLNTHKMVFVMNSEDYMYRRGALVKARKSQHRVAASQHERFDKWHQGWLANHVTSSAERSVQNWLMGEEEEDMIPCKTTCLSTEVKGQTVNRYQVHYSGSKAPASP
ncbi:hypothetical protein INR49_019571 [Caranx melampygus]|nr:hypothetical protein INR49_019571 [Caranx melampygus]